MRGGRHNNTQNEASEELETLTKENELLKADVAEYKERIQKMLHVFDLIKDNIINAKIGKKVATLISQTGQTAETVIKTVGLTNGVVDMSKKMYVLWTSHRELIDKMATGSDEEKATAKKQLLCVVMRACEGKANPGLVNQYLDKMTTEYNNGRGKFQDERIFGNAIRRSVPLRTSRTPILRPLSIWGINAFLGSTKSSTTTQTPSYTLWTRYAPV